MGYDIIIEPAVKAPPAEQKESPEFSEEESWPPANDEEEMGGGDGQKPESEPLPVGKSTEEVPNPEDKRAKKKRGMPGLNGEPGDEIDKKRKAWLWERLEQERIERSDRDSGYTPISHGMTPEERENHKRFALIFYNRQIEDLISRVQELKSDEGPAQYSIYGFEWEGISRLIRERDGNKCRRCGLSEEDGVTLVVHHICPRKEGGSNWHSNLITVCRTCHAEVEDRPWLL